MKKIIYALLPFLAIPAVSAHCPLCTLGAAAAAGGAAYLGVSSPVIGLFIGAFAVSIGIWIAKLIKKRYIPFQQSILVAISFITTVVPINAILSDTRPLFISWIGKYGTTLAVDLFLIGSILGGLIVALAPAISSKITKIRNGKMIPYQGIMITFSILILIGIIIQIML